MDDNDQILQIPVSGELAEAVTRRAAAAGRGDDVAGFLRDIVASAAEPRGWFYGLQFLMVNDEGPDWEWRTYAVDADDARVVDGALVFTDAAGRTILALAAGRWKEVARRLERDRLDIRYQPVPEAVAAEFKAAAARQQGWLAYPTVDGVSTTA